MNNKLGLFVAIASSCLALNGCNSKAPEAGPFSKTQSTTASDMQATSAVNEATPQSVVAADQTTPLAPQASTIQQLEAQKAQLLTKQASLQKQQQQFNANPLAPMNPEQIVASQTSINGVTVDGGAGVSIDQAKIDAIFKAAQDGDQDAVQKAFDDLFADLQAKIDALQKQIEAASAAK